MTTIALETELTEKFHYFESVNAPGEIWHTPELLYNTIAGIQSKHHIS